MFLMDGSREMNKMRQVLQEFHVATGAGSSCGEESRARVMTARRCALALTVGLSMAAGSAYAAVFEAEAYVTDDQDALADAGFDEPAPFVDPNLVNPWGVAFSSTGPFWVANQGTATSTLYNSEGAPQSLVVSIPSAAGPTGTVFNSTSGFNLANGTPGL